MAEIRYNRFDGGLSDSTRKTTTGKFADISNADIFADPYSLKAVGELATLSNSSQYEFQAINGDTNTLYAIGKRIDNWYNDQWDFRYRVNPSTTSNNQITVIDLSVLPSHFWSNVDTNGDDVRVTTLNDNQLIEGYLTDFNTGTQTGFYILKNPLESFYVYYGNSQAEPSPYTLGNVYDELALAYVFDTPTVVRDRSGNGFDEPSNGSSMNYTQVQGFYGGGISNQSISSNDTSGISLGSSFSMSFLYFHDTATSTASVSASKSCDIQCNQANNRVRVLFDYASSSSFTEDSADNVLTPGQYHHIYLNVTATDDISVFVNGVKVIDSVGTNNQGAFDHVTAGDPRVSTTNNGVVDMVLVSNSAVSESQITAVSNMHLNGAYSSGNRTDFTNITPTYSGLGIYERGFNDTIWTLLEYIEEQNIGLALPGFLEGEDGSFDFLTRESLDFNQLAFIYKGSVADNVLDTQNGTLGTGVDRLPVFADGADGNRYISNNADVAQIQADGSVGSTVISTGGNITAMSSYKTYLALATTKKLRTQVELWNYSAPNTNIQDWGDGVIRTLNTVDGLLVGVTDRYLDDSLSTRSKGSLEVAISQGSNPETLITFEVDTLKTKADVLDTAVLPQSYVIDGKMVFYAEVPWFTGETKKGIWQVGKNSANQWVCTFMVDTSDISRVRYFWAGYQQMYIIGDNDEVYTLSDDPADYYVTTEAIGADNPHEEKYLDGLRIAHKPLISGQTVKTYLSFDNGAFIEVRSDNTVGSVGYDSIRVESTGEHFDHFKEVRVKVEVTGGAELTGIEADINLLSDTYE